MIRTIVIGFIVTLLVNLVHALPLPQAPAGGFAAQTVAADDLDAGAFAQWVDGNESPMIEKKGPHHLIWTKAAAPEWNGAEFGQSKQPGSRHLRIGFNRPIAMGTVLTRAGGRLSVLKGDAAYPGDLADETKWIAATRIAGGKIGTEEAGREEYALWILPSGTSTRALRFSHVADVADKSYAGWLGGVYVLPQRIANIGPMATATASARDEAAGKLIDCLNNNGWQTWDNGKEGAAQLISERPEWVLLTWPTAVKLAGLNMIWAGFASCEVQTYAGPAERHPREAEEKDWKTVRAFDGLENQYPRSLGVNWLDFAQLVTTRAIRVKLTAVTNEGHPHLKNNTRAGKRVWLGEVLALTPLDTAELATVLLKAAEEDHPPIPVRFTLNEPGMVTLVIDDAEGKRVRNLVSQTPFPAGENIAWWDGLDDLGRDTDAARHGLYHVPGQFVKPGSYRVNGLTYKQIDLRYEFSVYNAGKPVWETADGTGCWTTNHTPPCGTLFVPADRSPTGKSMVYIGSYVAEGGHGLAWVDLDGKKVGGRGWIGGNWTGGPFLARDAGENADPNAYVYVASAWEKELRLTAIAKAGDKSSDKVVAKYAFESKETTAVEGLAVRNGLLVCTLPKAGQLLLVDAKAGKVLGATKLEDGRGVAFDAQGRLLVLAGKQLERFTVADGGKLAARQTLVQGLEDPWGLALDATGSIYISDRGNSQQVKVFSTDGKLLRSIGHPGAMKAGPYDPLHLSSPKGITIDERNHLWVAEDDFQPKRVSVWTLDGQLVNAFYGPGEYGGGGKLDPQDKTRFYFHGMEFKLDWEKGTDQLVRVYYRPGPGELGLPDGHAVNGYPETPIYIQGRRYFTNCYNCNPTNGAAIAMLWIDRDGLAVPVAAMGRANDWKKVFGGEEFKSRLPAGMDVKGDYWKNQITLVWSDLNGDAKIQPDEVQFAKTHAGGITVMGDMSFIAARMFDSIMRLPVQKYTDAGVPVYNLADAEKVVEGANSPASSGGEQALRHPDGWTVSTNAPKPYTAYSLGGAFKGTPVWAYPNLWPGLHASHEAPTPSFAGEVIGTTRMLGDFITPKGSDAGALWCINGNMGPMYLFTLDGLFVAELFKDVRVGRSWSMPVAQRGMLLNDVTTHDENFWPSITQVADGQVYLVDGGRSSLVKVEGLEGIRRLPQGTVRVSEDDLKIAQAWNLRREMARQTSAGSRVLAVASPKESPKVDGKLDEWTGADWASIDKRGVAANFNSNSKPYDVSAAVAVNGGKLFVAWRTGDKDLLKNTGEVVNAPFKTGGALDVMIGANASADPKRTRCVEGDQRLLVTVVKGKKLAVLYRAVAPGVKEPVPFSSPWRTITIDRVQDISDRVELDGVDGDYEISVPLDVLGLKPAAGAKLKADVGILRGNGFQTLQRVCWNNKATAITADVPSEAELTPALWGTWQFK